MRKDDITKVKFLVKEHDGNFNEVFAYFPDSMVDAKEEFRLCYAHIGQHSSCHPDYAKESREASYEEYRSLLKELKNQGYDNLLVLNNPPKSMEQVLKRVNWHMLREQKATLVHLVEEVLTDSGHAINVEGVISLIDSLQDMAVIDYGVPEKDVFSKDIDIDDQLIDDILTTALEGGITYWAVKCKIVDRGTALEKSFASDVVSKGGTIEITDEDGDVWKINRETITKGIKMFIEEQREFEDAGDLDAGDADLIVQYAVYDEIIFG